MEFHELANIFPMLGGAELDELCADIEKNGLAEPITLYDGKVLDGRNRATACQKLEIVPDAIEYAGDDPVGFVLSKNLHRRHLTESQRAMVASKLATLQPHRPSVKNKSANLRTYLQDAENKEFPAQSSAISQPEAAKLLNVSERQVQNAAKLRREAAPEVIEQVERGEKTIHAALPKKTPKEPPRRKTVAKEPAPEPKAEKKYIQVEQCWEQEIETMSAWWETMPLAYRQLTGGEELTGCMKIPAPFHHNVVLALFRKMCIDAGDSGEEIRIRLIAEVKLLADRIEELNEPE